MLHIIDSEKSVAEIRKIFPDVVAAHKFGLLGVHDLRGKMNEKGIAFDKECLVFEICNPFNAKTVLEADLAISTALPCRVSAYASGTGSRLATLSPTALLKLFGRPELGGLAAELEKVIYAIMADAAGKTVGTAAV
jgi:uncharacterized protein (DUF302 family)